MIVSRGDPGPRRAGRAADAARAFGPGLLLAAIVVLALGAGDASRAMDGEPTSPWRLAGGVTAGCGAGFFYSMLNAILRYCMTRGAPLPTSLFIVSTVGTISLGSLAWLRLGSGNA